MPEDPAFFDEETAGFARDGGDERRDDGTSPTRIGLRVGDYTIKRILGTGGMGTVYLAQQESPRRPVALKMMKPGIVSRAALHRFEFEAQILGRLRHPNIAQVYEAGTQDDGSGGTPYFAMEYIPNARTITEYAVEHRLGTRERLVLFAKVCDAVHHGHQKGIIHRDLKPGNVLVDSSGEPRIIDFGVARATDSDMAVTTLQTDVGQFIGTLQYMSPEQCEADPHDLDTRSDVYALGVLLYQLLTDTLPYDISRVAMIEAARVIREALPTRLSSINRALRGDVETITLKAMEKERARRYQSAADLARDIGRYLCNEPIAARPPSMAYQVRKFAARHRAACAAMTSIMVVLAVATAVSVAFGLAEAEQRDRAEARHADAREAQALAEQREAEAARARDDLEAIVEFQAAQLGAIDVPGMGDDIRDAFVAELEGALAGDGTPAADVEAALADAEELLDRVNMTDIARNTLDRSVIERALRAVDDEFAEQPRVRARLKQTLATTLRDLGLNDRAMEPQAEALALRRAELGDDHPDTIISIIASGTLLARAERFDEAERYVREAIERARRVHGAEHPRTLDAMNNMCSLLFRQERFAEAEPHLRDLLEARRRVLGNEHPMTLDSISNMGAVLAYLGRLDEAEPYFRQAMEGRSAALGEEHRSTVASRYNLAGLLREMGRLDDAEPLYREVLAARRRMLGDEHYVTIFTMTNTGILLRLQGRLAEAERLLREAADTSRRVAGPENTRTMHALGNLAIVLYEQDRSAEAEPLLRETLETRRRVWGDEDPDTLSSIANLGEFLAIQGRHDEAEPLLRAAVTGQRRVLGPTDPATLDAMAALAALLRDTQRLEEAEALGAEAVRGARTLRWQAARRRDILQVHARTLIVLERFPDAEAHLLEARELESSASTARDAPLAESFLALYRAWHAADPGAGHDERAARWSAALAAIASAENESLE